MANSVESDQTPHSFNPSQDSLLRLVPAGTWRKYNVASTSMQRCIDVEATLYLHDVNTTSPQRWRKYNVASTSMQRHDVASTLRRRCIYVMCLPGSVWILKALRYHTHPSLSVHAPLRRTALPACIPPGISIVKGTPWKIQYSRLSLSRSPTLWNTSKYPYHDISDLKNLGTNKSYNQIS